MTGGQRSPDVVIAGAGPVGLTLAIELARRGVRSLLVERRRAASHLPKMERCNARTMELFRRMGIAERVRAAGLPSHVPMDVWVMTRLVDEPILRLAYPSVDDHRAVIARATDGSQPREPYQLISQYVLEPLLRAIAEEHELVTVRFACELVGLAQDAGGVTVGLRCADGTEDQVRTRYLVGCDGGTSTVRKMLDIALSGRGGIGSLRQVQFRCDELLARVPIAGRGRHFCFADVDARMIGSTMVVQSDQRHFTLHTGMPEDTDFGPVIRGKIGVPVDLDVVSVNPWKLHLLLADRYGRGRVFLAGDAAHLVIPQGGLGLNTGIGDAVDLAWKLAGTLAGWGGAQLLESYEIERRQVAARNLRASAYAAEGSAEWRKASTAAVADDTELGRAIRTEVARQADVHLRKSHEMRGIELGYRYVHSPVIAYDASDDQDEAYSHAYVPSGAPGHRLPHVWLRDGVSVHDRLGDGYTLLRLDGTLESTRGLEDAMRAAGAPLEVLEVPAPSAREVLGADLLLIRPDQHVAWRGDRPPADAARVTAAVTGRT